MNEYFEIEKLENNSLKLLLFGFWTKENLNKIAKDLETVNFENGIKLFIDFEDVKEFDNVSIIYLISILKNLKDENVLFLNFKRYEKSFELFKKHYQTPLEEELKRDNFFESIGKKTFLILKESKDFLSFLGKIFYFFIYSIFNPKKIRFKATLKYIETSAVNALLIVGITSFLVGVVIAYQGAVQLEKFGANIFIVEMIAITMFREIAPLVTAIVIAGRSASAYTAEIGAMKITEEIDAMRTMSFEPILFLTLPRIFALCISLPLLVFFADIIGIFGGMLIAYTNLDVSFVEFITRLHNEVALKHLLIGVFKAFFFGFIIAIIGSYRGLQVENNTTSIGKYTTISVVNAIFVVILIDAIFSIIFTQLRV